ncbi:MULTISPECIES: aspartate--ammonia ligase [Pseudidiomarina]|uniref:Aspartate--ammonia ligase n=1 Tax=Pseudidiomarina homiensis TaxID=364198 RepID=A0A432Y5F1_9GAMM|nr:MULTISPECIES: aspartate--ammonia ligase [Pseudidiomarina]RUO56218.1 aspartate--ammonia ligase [Pseudidiomarina homiensis]
MSITQLKLHSQAYALKHEITQRLCKKLNLAIVQAPLIVPSQSGLQDTLSGHEKPVSLVVRAEGQKYEVVHSLAKWKRAILAKYQAQPGEGVIAHMLALRPDEASLSSRHSVQVDQWDWEQVVAAEMRTLSTLKDRVRAIYSALREAAIATEHWRDSYADEVFFIHSEELREMYPNLSAKQREREITRMHRAVFIIGIGGVLSDGDKHDDRAADYDDWTSANDDGLYGLNGDLLVWHEGLDDALELSSMGIRVTPEVMVKQLALKGALPSLDLPWHKKLIAGEFPTTIGGGIGQSRVTMWLLQQEHIQLVQAPTAHLGAGDVVLTEQSREGLLSAG